jgi:hypothetical protein
MLFVLIQFRLRYDWVKPIEVGLLCGEILEFERNFDVAKFANTVSSGRDWYGDAPCNY